MKETQEELQNLAATEGPLTTEQWGRWLEIASAHDSEGRPICQKCGVPIPAGKEILLTDDEKKALPPGLEGAFRHVNDSDCRRRSG